MAKILVVDDERALLDTLQPILRKAGHEVQIAWDGEEALQIARGEPTDLIILDVMLPRISGLEVCRILRRESDVPILMLTAMGDEVDKVLGLEVGADDYLTKPFGSKELLARVQALLRRAEMTHTGEGRGDTAANKALMPRNLKINDLEVDLVSRRATHRGVEINLKPKEFDLLAFLILHRGQTFTSQQLLKEVWGYGDTTDTRTVVVHIRWLREKVEVSPSQPEMIETVRGAGYRFRE